MVNIQIQETELYSIVRKQYKDVEGIDPFDTITMIFRDTSNGGMLSITLFTKPDGMPEIPEVAPPL